MTMGFDDEVDSARRKLEEDISHTPPTADTTTMLQKLLPLLQARIQSRRLIFQFTTDEVEGAVIEVLHTQTDEPLGFVFAEDSEYVFESNLEDYFDDFVDDDSDSFLLRLYETLRADLPKYEVESGK
jgi:hypothetical protein